MQVFPPVVRQFPRFSVTLGYLTLLLQLVSIRLIGMMKALLLSCVVHLFALDLTRSYPLVYFYNHTDFLSFFRFIRCFLFNFIFGCPHYLVNFILSFVMLTWRIFVAVFYLALSNSFLSRLDRLGSNSLFLTWLILASLLGVYLCVVWFLFFFWRVVMRKLK